MDPNQPSNPEPETPVEPTPVTPEPPTPPVQPVVPTPTPAAPSQMPPASTGGSSGKKIAVIIIAVVAVLLLVGGGILFAAVRTIQNRASDTQEQSEDNEAAEAEETGGFEQSVSATYLTDFDEVCKKVATIDNSTAYIAGETPSIAVLKQSPVSETFTPMSPVFKDKSITAADYNAVTKTQLVACLTVESTKDISGVCEAEQDGKKVSLKKTAVTYKLEVYEAKSGKKVGTGSVDGPITSCPFLVYYDANDPRVYGDPDSVKMEAAILAAVK